MPLHVDAIFVFLECLHCILVEKEWEGGNVSWRVEINGGVVDWLAFYMRWCFLLMGWAQIEWGVILLKRTSEGAENACKSRGTIAIAPFRSQIHFCPICPIRALHVEFCVFSQERAASFSDIVQFAMLKKKEIFGILPIAHTPYVW